MTGRIQALLAGAAFALYAACGAAAFAQGAAPAAGPMGPHGPHGPGSGAMMRDHGLESPSEHAQKLRDLLQLKPAQEPALQGFVNAIDAAHRSMMSGAPTGAMPATTPERLAWMQQMMAQHQAAMTAVIDATRRFYDQLDPAQKRAFDAIPMPMMRHRMMSIMGGPGMMDGPPDADGKAPPPPPPR